MHDSAAGEGGSGTGIHVNDLELTSSELEQLQSTYGVTPSPGYYWYDPRSGVYGAAGQAGVGFMMPGHEFGALDPECSDGNTGVFVNGRNLPNLEWMLWSRILGAAIHPGRYWLDANGDAGLESNPMPLVNFVQAAAASAGGTGGDNIWSSRFGAGNYDQGGARGYVSVPGHGPIGYGF